MFLLPCQGSRTVGRGCASQTLPEGKQQRGPTTLLLLFFCPLMAPQGMWNMRPATAAAVGACGAPETNAPNDSEHWFQVPRMPPRRPQSPGACSACLAERVTGSYARHGGDLKTCKPTPQDGDSSLGTGSRIDREASKGVEYNPPSPNRVGIYFGAPNGVSGGAGSASPGP